MKIVVHYVNDCRKCHRCKLLFKKFRIKAEWIRDDPQKKNTKYPEIQMIFEHWEMIDLIDLGVIGND